MGLPHGLAVYLDWGPRLAPGLVNDLEGLVIIFGRLQLIQLLRLSLNFRAPPAPGTDFSANDIHSPQSNPPRTHFAAASFGGPSRLSFASLPTGSAVSVVGGDLKLELPPP